MIERLRQLKTVERLLSQYPVVAILDARQVGKPTLAQMLVQRLERPSTVFDLERRQDLARLEDP